MPRGRVAPGDSSIYMKKGDIFVKYVEESWKLGAAQVKRGRHNSVKEIFIFRVND